MLPAGNRLRRREDFATAVRRGKRAGRRHLVAHLYVERPSGEAAPVGDQVAGRVGAKRVGGTVGPQTAAQSAMPPRAGFVVSRAVGGATVRNRVKRQLRHLVRERLVELPPGSLVVIRALPPAAQADSVALGVDLDAALRRLLGRNASGARR